MTLSETCAGRATDPFLRRFVPIAVASGLGLSAMGAPLSTLPRYVHDTLGSARS